MVVTNIRYAFTLHFFCLFSYAASSPSGILQALVTSSLEYFTSGLTELLDLLSLFVADI